jgi:hypothetical protein
MDFQPHAEIVFAFGGPHPVVKVQIGVAAGGSEADRLEGFADDAAADAITALTEEQKQRIIDGIREHLGI